MRARHRSGSSCVRRARLSKWIDFGSCYALALRPLRLRLRRFRNSVEDARGGFGRPYSRGQVELATRSATQGGFPRGERTLCRRGFHDSNRQSTIIMPL